MVKQLEDYYCGDYGDAAWRANVEWARTFWVGSELQKTLLCKLHDDVELAAVVYAKVGEGCLEWLETRVPGLGRRKPISCLHSKNLILRLRVELMRID
jgi:hypothetical protein